MKKTVVAAAIGECVHVAGVMNFLRLAEEAGWKTVFLGPAVPIAKVLEVARSEDASLVGVGYRLTPETGERLLGEFAEAADELRSQGVRFVFGGTPPVAERASKLGFFDRIYDGNQSVSQILAYLKGETATAQGLGQIPQTTIERIQWKAPYPLLRHHFGLPELEATRLGITQIAQAEVLDVFSLGTDQDAQENFFHPERQNPRARGAGGVPVRSADDYRLLYAASRSGNYPLMRAYSGTDDFIRLAEVLVDTIHNAWCAIPLFWFNQMDGRGPWNLQNSIREHQKVMRWYGEHNIPVELNEPHHWGMRDAPDVIFVVAAYLAAYNARAFGVRDYIAQFMFNSPAATADAMDLAKMLAILKMIEPLSGADFRIWKQTRTGLLSYPLQPAAARAHLAASIYVQMALHPHIVHIVGHTEADHAATADDVIEACQMAQRAIENALRGAPDMLADSRVQARAEELESEARITLDALRMIAREDSLDPLTDPVVLANAVSLGILDAPQLRNNPFARGEINTRMINGKCLVIDTDGHSLNERQRLKAFFR
jgi:methylmalonyl-CoA mutase cobalamin-binding subunit